MYATHASYGKICYVCLSCMLHKSPSEIHALRHGWEVSTRCMNLDTNVFKQFFLSI